MTAECVQMEAIHHGDRAFAGWSFRFYCFQASMYQYQNALRFILCDSRNIYGWYWLQDNRCNAKTVLYWMMTKCEEKFGSLLF